MVAKLSRRHLLLTSLVAAPAAGLGYQVFKPQAPKAADYVDLGWDDLLPEGETFIPPVLAGLIDHTTLPLSSQQPASSGVRTEWNHKTVRIPGFVVPLDYDATNVSTFILVPYVGACVHVPPPPANQLVFVTVDTPFESGGLFQRVYVTGKFGVSSLTTDLANIGYAMTAEKIEVVEA